MANRSRSECFGDYSHLDPECKACSCSEHCIGIQLRLAIDAEYDRQYEEWKEVEEWQSSYRMSEESWSLPMM